MKNLKAAVTRELKGRAKENKETIQALETIEDLLSKWHIKDLIPSSSKGRAWTSANELKTYLFARIDKRLAKSIEDKVNRIDTVYSGQDVKSIIITMDWKNSRMWGSNPKAEAKVSYKDGTCSHFESERVGGCGYDKGSTAVAQCLNQVNGLLKKLYKVKNKSMQIDNRELIGYGSGYGILPSIEGGVGVGCYDSIMKSIGLKFETIASNKHVDVYSISR